jgi:hypothetical protein
MIAHRKLAAIAAWLFGFTMTLFVGLIVYDTLRDDAGRIEPLEGQAWGWRDRDGQLVVRYDHGFRVNRAGTADLLRKVVCVCPKGEIDEYDFPPLRRYFDEGEYPALARYLTSPLKEPPGAKCSLLLYAVWRNSFAISNSLQLVDTLEFTVTEKSP